MGDNIIPLKYNKNKKAFKHNVKVEMQALAIAY